MYDYKTTNYNTLVFFNYETSDEKVRVMLNLSKVIDVICFDKQMRVVISYDNIEEFTTHNMTKQEDYIKALIALGVIDDIEKKEPKEK
jgi:hypothetical protein